MKTVFLLSFLFLVWTAKAQVDSSVTMANDSLYARNLFFSIYPKVLNRGRDLTKEEASALFSRVPESARLYQQYRRRYKRGIYSFGGVFLGTAISAIAFNKGNKGVAASGLVLSVFSFVGSVVFLSSEERDLKRAMRVYNQSTLRP